MSTVLDPRERSAIHLRISAGSGQSAQSKVSSTRKIPQMSARAKARRSQGSSYSSEPSSPLYAASTKLAFAATELRFPHPAQSEEEARLKMDLAEAQRSLSELQAELERPRITTAEACKDLQEWILRTSDPLLPNHSGPTIPKASRRRGFGCIG